MMEFDAQQLRKLIQVNAIGRVFCSCRAHGIEAPTRLRIYAEAVQEAVLAVLRDSGKSPSRMQAVLTEQVDLLEAALSEAAARRPLVPNLGSQVAPVVSVDPSAITPRGEKAGKDPPSRTRQGGTVEARTMEARLQVERKPLRKLIGEDSVSLGLVSKNRAESLVNGLAGRTREQAEADIVAELRNNLHQQIRQYIRRHKGGPWPSPKAQEELRLEVVTSHHIHGVLTLARQVLQERKKWESSRKKGALQSFLGGKLKLGFGRE